MSPENPEARDGFLSRWSQRKQAAAVEKATAPVESNASNPSTGEVVGANLPETPHLERSLPIEHTASPPLPAVESLTAESDFSPFMAKDVDPGIRNEAMKKLFTDTHYRFENMDKLDIYIDDYSKPDPIPLSMLKLMNQSRTLGLFDTPDEEEQKATEQPVDVLNVNENVEPPVIESAGPVPTVESAEPVVVESGVSQQLHPKEGSTRT